MEAWKAMIAVTVMLVWFAVIASLTDISLSGSSGLYIVGAVIGGSLMFYVTSKRGYDFGKRIGDRMGDKD